MNLVKNIFACAAVICCLGVTGCKHVEFERGTTGAPKPNVLPGSGGRFDLNFVVANPTDNNYAFGTFEVTASCTYFAVNNQVCHTDFTWTVPYLDAKTGRIEFNKKFDSNNFAGDPCRCMNGQCNGGILLTLKWKTGSDAGKKVKGGNTKLNVAWDKSGDPNLIVITDHGGT